MEANCHGSILGHRAWGTWLREESSHGVSEPLEEVCVLACTTKPRQNGAFYSCFSILSFKQSSTSPLPRRVTNGTSDYPPSMSDLTHI